MKKLLVLMMIVVLSACSGEKDAVVKSGLNEEYVESIFNNYSSKNTHHL